MLRQRIFHGFILLLVLSTAFYSVVNSAQQIGAKEESSGEVACSIVVAMCALDSNAGFCSTAAYRQCDAMQPSPLAGLTHSGAEVTFFLTLTTLFAGFFAMLLVNGFGGIFQTEVASMAGRIVRRNYFQRSGLLAEGFSSLRF